jgi:hypothetical protein
MTVPFVCYQHSAQFGWWSPIRWTLRNCRLFRECRQPIPSKMMRSHYLISACEKRKCAKGSLYDMVRLPMRWTSCTEVGEIGLVHSVTGSWPGANDRTCFESSARACGSNDMPSPWPTFLAGLWSLHQVPELFRVDRVFGVAGWHSYMHARFLRI